MQTNEAKSKRRRTSRLKPQVDGTTPLPPDACLRRRRRRRRRRRIFWQLNWKLTQTPQHYHCLEPLIDPRHGAPSCFSPQTRESTTHRRGQDARRARRRAGSEKWQVEKRRWVLPPLHCYMHSALGARPQLPMSPRAHLRIVCQCAWRGNALQELEAVSVLSVRMAFNI